MYDIYGNFVEANGDQSFFEKARAHVSSFLTPVTEFAQTPAGSQLMNAIYEYGRGKVDAAREKAVGAFLMTSEGKKIQAEGVRQTTTQYMPVIVLAMVGLFSLFVLTRR